MADFRKLWTLICVIRVFLIFFAFKGLEVEAYFRGRRALYKSTLLVDYFVVHRIGPAQ